MSYSRKTYTEQGETFKIVKTSKKNRARVREYFAERNDRIREVEEMTQAHAVGERLDEDIPEIDDFEVYWDLFVMLTDGPHDEIDRDDFDEKLGEAVYADFLPQAKKTRLQLQGFLPADSL